MSRGSKLSYRMGRLGRVVIPVQVREQLGIEPGQQVVCSLENGAAVIRPLQRTMFSQDEVTALVAEVLTRMGVQASAPNIKTHLAEIVDQQDAKAVYQAIKGGDSGERSR